MVSRSNRDEPRDLVVARNYAFALSVNAYALLGFALLDLLLRALS
jgi:hypothetical protein